MKDIADAITFVMFRVYVHIGPSELHDGSWQVIVNITAMILFDPTYFSAFLLFSFFLLLIPLGRSKASESTSCKSIKHFV